MARLSGKRILITGSGGGQGEAAQRLFCMEGAAVVGCDRRSGAAESTASEIRAAGFKAWGQTVDLSVPDAAANWVHAGVTTLGGLDGLYNNAGTPEFAGMAQLTADQWHATITSELHTAFYTTSAAWPHLGREGGSIINTASVLATVAASQLGAAAHCAAKGGLIAFTRALAAEGAPDGIRANAISPGFVLTPGTRAVPSELVTYVTGLQMIGRSARPEEIAYLALYLASDESSFVTGADFAIDGGWSAGSADGPPRHSFRQAPTPDDANC